MADAVTVQGADRLARTLDGAADDLRDLSEVNAEAGAFLRARAAARAPRRTGRLAGSLRVTVEAQAAEVVSPLHYAAPVHWGVPSRNIAAQPFLLEALRDNEQRVVDMYDRNNERTLSQVHGI